MSRYGAYTKKDIEYLLKTGCKYIENLIKDKEEETEIINEIERIKAILYNEGEILSDSAKVKFESKINHLEKMLIK